MSPSPSIRGRSQRRPGFTLVEMLIAVVLSTLVGILIYRVFIEQTRAYRAQSDLGTMQQNLRIAMELITRNVATAGWGVGYDGGTWGAGGQGGNDNNPQYAIYVRENFPVGYGSDAIELTMMNSDRGTWAVTDSNTPTVCNTSVITFTSEDAAKASNYGPTGGNYGRIMCMTPARLGRPASFIWDVAAVGDPVAGTVQVNANAQTDFTTNCQNSLPVGMICSPASTIAYYVDKNSADGIGIGSSTLPVLYLVPDVVALAASGGYPHADDIPVALGIEDLQFRTCAHTDALAVDCELDASWSTGQYDLSPSTVEWWNLQAVRVMMTARTIRPDESRTSVSTPVDLVPGDSYSPAATADGYHRRVARTEVSMRNATGTWQMMNAPW
jgi:prepilin-type N-terminal cleavage/methylation domain-containing protein